jgi:hypothetical protein
VVVFFFLCLSFFPLPLDLWSAGVESKANIPPPEESHLKLNP